MLRIVVLILSLCAVASPALAYSCQDQTCPDGGGKANGVWPYCGCKRPASCPLRNHTYTCGGYVFYATDEQGVTCSCDYAPPSKPGGHPTYCQRLKTIDGQSCMESPMGDGSCVCP